MLGRSYCWISLKSNWTAFRALCVLRDKVVSFSLSWILINKISLNQVCFIYFFCGYNNFIKEQHDDSEVEESSNNESASESDAKEHEENDEDMQDDWLHTKNISMTEEDGGTRREWEIEYAIIILNLASYKSPINSNSDEDEGVDNNSEEGGRGEFAEYTPVTKKRRIENTKSPNPTTNTAPSTPPANNSLPQFNKTPLTKQKYPEKKHKEKTALICPRTPSKNSPFSAYKPFHASGNLSSNYPLYHHLFIALLTGALEKDFNLFHSTSHSTGTTPQKASKLRSPTSTHKVLSSCLAFLHLNVLT